LEHFEGTIVAAVRSIKMKWEGGDELWPHSARKRPLAKKLGKRERKTSQKCIKKAAAIKRLERTAPCAQT